MKLSIRESNNINIIDIDGKIDINSAEIIEAVGWLMKNKKKNILLNFERVNMIDYSGISILAIAYKNVINNKGKMKFCSVPLHIEELFKLVRLDPIFEIYKNEEAALSMFNSDSTLEAKLLRRRFTRLDAHIDVEFCAMDDPRMTWHSGKILNLSGNGLFLFTHNTMPLGKEVALKIRLKDKSLLETRGVIIWLADKRLQPQSYPGMGIYFKNISKSEQDKVLEFVDRHLIGRSTTLM